MWTKLNDTNEHITADLVLIIAMNHAHVHHLCPLIPISLRVALDPQDLLDPPETPVCEEPPVLLVSRESVVCLERLDPLDPPEITDSWDPL